MHALISHLASLFGMTYDSGRRNAARWPSA